MIDPIALLMALVLAMFNFSGQVQNQVEEKKETTVQSQTKETPKKAETPKKSETSKKLEKKSSKRSDEMTEEQSKEMSRGEELSKQPDPAEEDFDTLDWACEGIALDEEYEACIDEAGKEYN